MWKSIQFALISIILFNVNTGYAKVRVYDLKKFGIRSESKWTMLPDGDGNLKRVYLGESKIETLKSIDPIKDIQFFLYTRDNVNNSYQLFVDDVVNLKESPFDANVPTKFIVHGWGDTEDGNLIQSFKNDYLSVGDYNMIGIDWSKLSSKLSYYPAVLNTVPTGEYCAEMVRHLVNNGNLQPSDLHIIGFSLGSHVAGLIGKKYGRYQIGRVTALDAALPLYAEASEDVRVYRGDAIFVDAIHGAGGVLGFMSPFADMDFYANGGRVPQPGCILDIVGSCSHKKVPGYYLKTITQPFLYPSQECADLDALAARNCYSDPESTPYMGAGATYIDGSSGIFYSSTKK